MIDDSQEDHILSRKFFLQRGISEELFQCHFIGNLLEFFEFHAIGVGNLRYVLAEHVIQAVFEPGVYVPVPDGSLDLLQKLLHHPVAAHEPDNRRTILAEADLLEHGQSPSKIISAGWAVHFCGHHLLLWVGVEIISFYTLFMAVEDLLLDRVDSGVFDETEVFE